LGFSDVVSQDIGVEEQGKNMSVIIPRNSHFPTTKENLYAAMLEGQTKINLRILQGNKSKSSECEELSVQLLEGWNSSPLQKPKFSIKMFRNYEGTLETKVQCLTDSTWGEKTILATAKEKLTLRITPEDIATSKAKILSRMQKRPNQSASTSSTSRESATLSQLSRLKKMISLSREATQLTDEAVAIIDKTEKWLAIEKNPSSNEVEERSSALLASLGDWRNFVEKALKEQNSFYNSGL